jgi:hypothetical protein
MNLHSMYEASGSKPALEPFNVLIGIWSTTGNHPASIIEYPQIY